LAILNLAIYSLHAMSRSDTIRSKRIDIYLRDWKQQGPICCRCGTSLYCCWPCPSKPISRMCPVLIKEENY